MEEGKFGNEEFMMLGNNGLGVKVMTDDQMEMLRKQISVYATLCESLVQMHKSFSSQQDHLSGMGALNPSCYGQLFPHPLNKIPSRQRWSPKPEQLEVLESIFAESSATPDKQKLRDIAAQLLVHGPISETNVYNWFQNRRARSKRKKSSPLPPPPNDNHSQVEIEAEAEPEPEPAKDKKTKPDETQLDDNENLALMVNHMYFQSPEIEGIDQLIGKAELPVSYDPYWMVEQHDLF